jgi:aldose 1-epimerase
MTDVQREPYAIAPNGTVVELLTLTNASGAEVRFLTLGGIIVSIKVPDRNGALDDVTIGYDTLDAYLADRAFLGALVGRYANRIAKGRFTLDGREYRLELNDGPNHLHGGAGGFHRAIWAAEPFANATGVGAVLTCTSRAGEEGYPGTLDVRVTYTLTHRDELIFNYSARTSRATPINLTQHSYFNLAGGGRGNILGHQLTINATRFTPVDATLIPTGELRDVRGTPFDFTAPAAIGSRIAVHDEQLIRGGGYDHNFVLNGGGGATPSFAARLHEPVSGRTLDVHTTEPGLQFYSGNALGDAGGAADEHAFAPRCALALETQHFPDSPNHPGFPSTILRPDAEFSSKTVYAFSTAA